MSGSPNPQLDPAARNLDHFNFDIAAHQDDFAHAGQVNPKAKSRARDLRSAIHKADVDKP